jgi:hypothetical protein
MAKKLIEGVVRTADFGANIAEISSAQKIKELEASLNERTSELAELRKATATLTSKCNAYEKTLKERDAKVAELTPANIPDELKADMVEIAAYPSNGVTVSPIKKMNGKEYPYTRVDNDGVFYWVLPTYMVGSLLTDKSGLRHVLIGPMDYLIVNAMRGNYTESVKVLKHRKNRTTGGAISWMPVEVEESK